MKRFAVAALALLAGIFTASTVQAQGHEVRANIPFDFAVGGTHLPSGYYSFSTQGDDMMLIRNADRQIVVLSRTDEISNPADYKPILIFNKYGDRYFLHEISCPSIAVNVEIPASKMERQTRSLMAWRGPDQVLLALN